LETLKLICPIKILRKEDLRDENGMRKIGNLRRPTFLEEEKNYRDGLKNIRRIRNVPLAKSLIQPL
jgi:hypothetical protein